MSDLELRELREIKEILKKILLTQENLLRLFRKYDDDYVKEAAKDGFLENP